ncbi:MAG: hypothetical protein KDA41_05745 [Planctomycetales bacterium]|nr:hypothetical protein [Planctomycetales bacterium]
MLLTSANAAQAQGDGPPPVDPGRTWKESDSDDGRWNETDVGPFLASVLSTPSGPIAKGLSIKLDDAGSRCAAYDTANCLMRCTWSGGFLKFSSRRYGMTSAPEIAGAVGLQFDRSGWGEAKRQFRGLRQNGNRVALEYDVGGCHVWESPAADARDGLEIVTRTFEIGPRTAPLSLALLSGLTEPVVLTAGRQVRCKSGDACIGVSLACSDDSVSLKVDNGAVSMHVAAGDKAVRAALRICRAPGAQAAAVDQAVAPTGAPVDVRELFARPSTRWPQWIATGGERGAGEGPYVIDTVQVPFENPYRALMFTSGFDFFPSGDIAVCTLHGDVWLVRGVDDDLSDVKWKRYATGLCQPLGLKIVDGKAYVLGKDQITRLHDVNGDDEADFYECFNNGGQTSLGGHDYASCLETDPEGNFYYIRAHEGVCRVSADGRTHESIATGFRNPIGLGVSPEGMVTAAPQEGTWTPSSCLFAVKPGGYYGFGGPRVTADRPLGYDPPLCWMPRSQDNSSGGQAWVVGDKWGLPPGQMLHFSYGLCALLAVMHESVDGTPQGGTVKLPLFFESGVMRGRFSPRDGQLYACGLVGWQTAAAKDGCLQRARYTGGPVHLPVGLHVKPDGIAITFQEELDPKTAANPDNYFIEQWNYEYSKEYGSKEYRPSDPKKFGRDEVFIDSATLSADGKTVYLKLEDIQPVMQMAVTYQIQAADGAKLKDTIYSTINVVPAQ